MLNSVDVEDSGGRRGLLMFLCLYSRDGEAINIVKKDSRSLT